jgi:hypothetical protein
MLQMSISDFIQIGSALLTTKGQYEKGVAEIDNWRAAEELKEAAKEYAEAALAHVCNLLQELGVHR